jgi:decaprenylphospho-beta-D-ribofuranose 2-oxidase
VRAALEAGRAAGAGAIPRGLGRSYGDAAQLAGGLVLEMTALKDFSLDAEADTLTAQAGVTLGELLDALVPAGWMLPVVPGTQHVSIGGAIASDIHGKNHGEAGTFGSHVQELGLMRSDGEIVRVERGADRDGLLAATLGGMGLTGVILWARIALRRVTSGLVSVDTDRVGSLDEALAALSAAGGPHRVAWLDLLCPRPGRGIVTRAEDLPGSAAPPDQRGAATVRARATVPASLPGGLLRPASIRAHNELRFRSAPRRERGQIEPIGRHMFPLDALVAWPRLYGPHGFLQYQLVVPHGAEHVLSTVIERLARERVPCYLAVLKDFGPANAAPLSFPMAGWTLALDIPWSARGVAPLLERFDELVAEAGGRVYLSKDARLRPEATAAMYPRLDEWRALRDRADPAGLWRSDLALRTGLVSGANRRPRTVSADMSSATDRRVLVLGGSSEIALAIVRRLAQDGPVRPYLLGRDHDRLVGALAELEQAGCKGGRIDVVDADEVGRHEPAVARAFETMGGFELVILAVGVLGAQAGLDADPEEALEVMRVNFVGSGSLLLESLRRLRTQGTGTLVVLSSVAAERPRAGNAIYGAAKAGLDALAQGLADAAAGTGVRVLVVRPGFVVDRMTAGLEPAPFATRPDAVAEATARALERGDHTVWVPGSLRLVFSALRHLPRPVYRRLPL